MQPNLNNLAVLLSGSGQQSAAAKVLAGLFSGTAQTSDGLSFGSELAALLNAAPGATAAGRSALLTTASRSALTAVPTSLPHVSFGAIPKTHPNAQNAGADVTVGSILSGLRGIDPELAGEIRNQILEAVEAGEIVLPPAWAKALGEDAPIVPQAGEETPDPAAVRDILATLGFIPSAPQAEATPGGSQTGEPSVAGPAAAHADGSAPKAKKPAPVAPAPASADIAEAPESAASAASVPGTESNQTKPGQPPLAHEAATAQTTVAPQTLRSGQPGRTDGERAGNPALQSNQQAAAGISDRGQTQTNTDGQNNGGTASDSGADPSHRPGQAAAGDKPGHSFLARLESVLGDRGLTVASLASNGIADPAAVDGVTLTQPTGAVGQTAHAAAQVASAPAATHAPAFTGWTPVAGQVAMQISRMVKDGNQEFTIRLDPPELGRVNVKMEITHDGKVNAVVSADNEKALQLLQRDQALLERALADAGLKADSGSLNFSLSQHNGTEYERADSGNTGSGSTFAGNNPAEEAGPVEDSTTLAVSDRALDIKV